MGSGKWNWDLRDGTRLAYFEKISISRNICSRSDIFFHDRELVGQPFHTNFTDSSSLFS